jgi:hypothetical protein
VKAGVNYQLTSITDTVFVGEIQVARSSARKEVKKNAKQVIAHTAKPAPIRGNTDLQVRTTKITYQGVISLHQIGLV